MRLKLLHKGTFLLVLMELRTQLYDQVLHRTLKAAELLFFLLYKHLRLETFVLDKLSLALPSFEFLLCQEEEIGSFVSFLEVADFVVED